MGCNPTANLGATPRASRRPAIAAKVFERLPHDSFEDAVKMRQRLEPNVEGEPSVNYRSGAMTGSSVFAACTLNRLLLIAR